MEWRCLTSIVRKMCHTNINLMMKRLNNDLG